MDRVQHLETGAPRTVLDETLGSFIRNAEKIFGLRNKKGLEDVDVPQSNQLLVTTRQNAGDLYIYIYEVNNID